MRTLPLPTRGLCTSSAKRIPPFDARALEKIRSRLSTPPPPGSKLPPHTVAFTRRPAAEAAVLIPLMNISGEAHVLMEVRAAKMRTHAGEISFPGGKIDPEDASIPDAALRETFEELRIPKDNVEVLGMLDRPEYSLGNRARVWPVVGFVHESADWRTSSDAPLWSLCLSKLVASPDEVAAILPLPLHTLQDLSRRRTHHFRVDPARPYHTIRAGDLVVARDVIISPELEVWGLSGWFLNRLAWRLGWMDRPRAEVYE